MWSRERPSEKGDDTGWGEHLKTSDQFEFNEKRNQSKNDIGVEFEDYGQHHRKNESTGDIHFQYSGS